MIRSSRIVFALSAPLTLAVLGTLVPAQASTFTVPPTYLTKPGNSLDQQPFGYDQSRHVTYTDKGYLTGLRNGAKISEIRYRREENRLDKVFSNYEPMRRSTAQIPNWEIRVSNFAGDYANLFPVYESTTNKVSFTTVFAGQLDYQVNTPNLSAPANPATPAPFALRFPFNVAQHVYDGTGLAVSHKVYASRGLSHIYYIDSIVSDPNNGGTVAPISPTSVGCPSGFNRVYGTAPNPGAGPVQLHLFGAPPNANCISFFGASKTTYAGAPLPLSLAFMNMAGCDIHCSLDFPVGTQTDFAGIASISVFVPAVPAFAGAVIYNQWGVTDDRVNPINNFTVSDGVEVTIGTNVGGNTVLQSVIGATGSQARSTAGYVQPNRGPVYQLVY